jgi:hypothetical protein
MNRAKRMSLLLVASVVLSSAAVESAHADEGLIGIGLKQFEQFLKDPVASVTKAIDGLVQGAKAKLQQAFQDMVLKPAVAWAMDRILPAGEQGYKMVRALFDRVARGAEALKTRVAAYGEALDAMAQKGGAALQGALQKAQAALDAVSSFDVQKALDTLKKIALERAKSLIRSRLAPFFDQALSFVVNPIRGQLEKIYDVVKKVPVLGELIVGFADNKVNEGIRWLRDQGITFVLGKVESLAQSAVDTVFNAARGAAVQAEAWAKPVIEMVKGLVAQAQGYVAQVQSQFTAVKQTLASIHQAVANPQKALADLKAKEEAKLVQAVAAEIKNAPDKANDAAARALAQANLELEKKKKEAQALLQKAAQTAASACGAKDAACIARKAQELRQKATQIVKQAEEKATQAAKQVISKVEVRNEVTKIFSPPKAGDAPKPNKFSQAPLTLTPQAQKDAAEAQKKAEAEITAVLKMPTTKVAPEVVEKAASALQAPKATTEVVKGLGAKEKRVEVKTAAKPHEAPVIKVKPGSGNAGVRTALKTIVNVLAQEVRAMALATKAALKLAGKLPAQLSKEYREGVSQMFRGVYNMYVAAARARIAQIPKLFSKMPAGLVTFVNSYLGKKPAYLAGLHYQAKGELGDAVEKGRQAAVRVASAGQRVVLLSRYLVSGQQWRMARAANKLFHNGLGWAKRGLRRAVEAIRLATPRAVAKK